MHIIEFILFNLNKISFQKIHKIIQIDLMKFINIRFIKMH